MKIEQFLLIKLMEECAELSQRASKTIQFGWDEKEPNQDKTNIERLQNELDDLLVMASLVGLDINLKEDKVVKKHDKILKYLEYSMKINEIKIHE